MARQVQFSTKLKHLKTSFLLRMTLKKYQQQTRDSQEQKGEKLCMIEDNPRQFFLQTGRALVDFIDDIEKILPNTMTSFEYRNPPNFES